MRARGEWYGSRRRSEPVVPLGSGWRRWRSPLAVLLLLSLAATAQSKKAQGYTSPQAPEERQPLSLEIAKTGKTRKVLAEYHGAEDDGDNSASSEFIRNMGAHLVIREDTSLRTIAASAALPAQNAKLSGHAETDGHEEHNSQPVVLDPDAMARLTFEKVQDEWNRKSCVAQNLANQLKPLPVKLDGLAADEYYATSRCNSILHIVTEEQSFHEDSIGLMLLKLERLLSLACLTGRTLVIPTATYGVLSRLIHLPALEAAGFCFVPANGPWKANAAKAWSTATRSRVNGLPRRADFNSAMEVSGTEPGLPLSHLADLITTDEHKGSALVKVSAARTLTTCSSTHDERLFFSKLAPPAQVLEQVQDFTFHFMTQHHGKRPWLSHEEFRNTAKAQHIGAPGSGHFTAVSPAPDADECRENAFRHFHRYKGAAERVAELCFPSSAAVLMAKHHVARSLPEGTFVPRGEGDKWRDAFNAALANFSDAGNYDGKGHSIQPALSYDPFQGEQLVRRNTDNRNAQMAFNLCKKQQQHDKSSVKAGACEAKKAAFLPSMDKKALEGIAKYVNFWMLTVANTFIGSAADPTSVVAANIRVAKGAARTVLEWESPDQENKDWRNEEGEFQTPSHIFHLHKHGSEGVEAFWRCEKICYWCGPERRSRC